MKLSKYILNIVFFLALGTPCIWGVESIPIDIRLEKVISFDTYAGVNPVMVQDLNGDGYPELITVQSDFRNNGAQLVILEGPSFAQRAHINFGASYQTPHVSFGYAAGPVAVARIDGRGQILHTAHSASPLPPAGMIYLVAGTEQAKLLYAYKYVSAKDIKEVATAPLQHNLYGMPGLADLDQDGRAEVYVGSEVFDALTLQPIALGTNSAEPQNLGRHLQHDGAQFTMALAADVLPQHPGLELVCGNEIYGKDDGVLTLLQRVGERSVDGSVILADFTQDGQLDIMVRNVRGQLSLFDPAKNTCLFDSSYLPMLSYPAVGDIDGNGSPELVGLSSNKTLSAYKYDSQRQQLKVFWEMDHTDVSAQTGMTLFDFNGDGKQEIVYRDEQLLRIINGSTQHPEDVVTFPMKSMTKSEYPVVADALANGTSQIIVPGVLYGEDKEANARIAIFVANTSVWQSACPFWNQYFQSPALPPCK